MKNTNLYLLYLLLLCLFTQCQWLAPKPEMITPQKTKVETPTTSTQKIENTPTKEYPVFERTESEQRIRAKINTGEALVVHALIPLCDNEHQGIVPVNARLGNGLNLNTNLYWGSKYGVNNYFKKIVKWKEVERISNPSSTVLERVIFYKEFSKSTSNTAKVYLVADAYRGDKMLPCLQDFFKGLSGENKESIRVNEQEVGVYGNADLLLFNGHNGLMDYEVPYKENVDNVIRDAAVIACVSHRFFKEHLKRAKAYPLLMTTNFMAPEAYVMDALIDSWVNLKEESEFRKEAGKAYHQYQKCGIKGATKLFKSGW